MPESIWDLSGTDSQCDSHEPGHQVFYIHFNVSMRSPSPVIPVTAVVDDDGLVHITGDDLSLVRWNHRPEALRAALQCFGGMADWKPRWHLLAVPMEAVIGSARSVFYLVAPERRSDCRVTRRVLSADPPPWGEPPEAWERYRQRAEAEQETRNAKLRRIDYSDIPPLRVAELYRHGRPKPRNKAIDRSGDDEPIT